ncbi:hypothetical protein ACFL14_00960 [Patescibacteria group bacterium]
MKILRFIYLSFSIIIAVLLFFYLFNNPYQARSYQKQNVFARKASQTELIQNENANISTNTNNIFINFWNRFNIGENK